SQVRRRACGRRHRTRTGFAGEGTRADVTADRHDNVAPGGQAHTCSLGGARIELPHGESGFLPRSGPKNVAPGASPGDVSLLRPAPEGAKESPRKLSPLQG